jgi:P27 family predicted phage terminase small subunit
MRGRKPIPTHLKLLRGDTGHRRLPAGEIEHDRAPEIPEPPAFLMPLAQQEWRRIATGLYHLGLLTEVDEKPLAAYCQAYARWCSAEDALNKMRERDLLTNGLMIKTQGGNAIQNPLVGTANKASSDMVRYATEFGFTPAARARIAGGADGSGSGRSKFAGLIGGRETFPARSPPRKNGDRLYREPDSTEREGSGPPVQTGDVAEEFHS